MSNRLKAISIGIVAAFFFSITFIVNEVMANAKGYWGYTAALRYLNADCEPLFGFQFGTRPGLHQTKLNGVAHLVTSVLCVVLCAPELGG